MMLFLPYRLVANQELTANGELISKNGLVALILQGDGAIVLVRTLFGVPLWTANTVGAPAAQLVMQEDGNLVAYAPNGEPVWSSGTAGNPGGWCTIQDDGNLVLYDSAGRALWASNTVQDFNLLAFVYTSSDQYTYDETSESWKGLCTQFPCFDALQWPGYTTAHRDTQLSGEATVVQLWKGHCQKFLGQASFPGGVGAEVGIYRRMPGRARPTALPFLPAALEAMVLSALSTLSDDELWWPFPELEAVIQLSLVNPITKEPFVATNPEATYWLTKWMDDESYSKYQSDQGVGRTPGSETEYTLMYTINGQGFAPW
jgi:hypothetical protein